MKTNYNHARRQKEAARKARQQEKLAKKLSRATTGPGTESTAPPSEPVPVESKDAP